MTKVLRIFASMRTEGSATRKMADEITKKLENELGPLTLSDRDLAVDGPAYVDAVWIDAKNTALEEIDDSQKATLAASDSLIEELKAADVVILATPIYNFGIPAALKAWVDLICRARVTFRYTENGPVGLLEGKKAIVAIASGGTKIDSEIDFATPYLRHVLGFVGIHDVAIYAADRQSADPDSLSKAIAAIAA